MRTDRPDAVQDNTSQPYQTMRGPKFYPRVKGIVSQKVGILYLVPFKSMEVSTPWHFVFFKGYHRFNKGLTSTATVSTEAHEKTSAN
jgi:hypothetical protein